MKKILYTLLAGVMALSSCSKSDEAPTASQPETTTFTLSVDEPTVQAAKASSRTTTTVTPARYIMEVWSENGSTAEKVFGTGTAATNRAEILASSGSSFAVVLDKTKAYTCLFWADDNITFNAASLKDIKLNTGKDVTEAYFSKVDVASGKNPAVAVTLKRAVAKITLTEEAAVKTTDNILLKISNIYSTFNVLETEAVGEATEWMKTIKPAAAQGTIGTLYFFAKTDKELSNMKFVYAAETEKTVLSIPLQQNYATNITGEYSNLFPGTFTITADNEGESPDNNVEFGKKAYKLGDIYPDATAPIGVVFWVDETHASYNSTTKTSTKGKIMSLDEVAIAWSTENIDIIDANHATDGAANTAKILLLGTYSAAKYPAFAWCANKNATTTPAGNWYIPAKNELKNEIYANIVALNAALTSAGATSLNTTAKYWSSTNYSDYYASGVDFATGAAGDNVKSVSTSIIRVVSAF